MFAGKSKARVLYLKPRSTPYYSESGTTKEVNLEFINDLIERTKQVNEMRCYLADAAARNEAEPAALRRYAEFLATGT